MAWSGLEYLTVPQWRMAFETADVIFGVDVVTGHEILVFSRDGVPFSWASDETDRRQILRVSIDGASDELELLTAACEAYRGPTTIRQRHEQRRSLPLGKVCVATLATLATFRDTETHNRIYPATAHHSTNSRACSIRGCRRGR